MTIQIVIILPSFWPQSLFHINACNCIKCKYLHIMQFHMHLTWRSFTIPLSSAALPVSVYFIFPFICGFPVLKTPDAPTSAFRKLFLNRSAKTIILSRSKSLWDTSVIINTWYYYYYYLQSYIIIKNVFFACNFN